MQIKKKPAHTSTDRYVANTSEAETIQKDLSRSGYKADSSSRSGNLERCSKQEKLVHDAVVAGRSVSLSVFHFLFVDDLNDWMAGYLMASVLRVRLSAVDPIGLGHDVSNVATLAKTRNVGR